MNLAVARLDGVGTGRPAGGTAFAITPRLALTMLHCLADVDDADRRHDEVLLHFGDAPPVRAAHLDSDPMLDVALLALTDPLPPGLEPLPLTGECFPNDLWISMGFPHAVEHDDVGGFALNGRVSGVDARIRRGAEAIQLHCEQAAAGMPLSGSSGGPVFVGRPPRVVGMIRSNIERSHGGPAFGAAVYATPLAAVGRRFPQVAAGLWPSAGPSAERDAAAEKQLLSRLPLASNRRRALRLTVVAAGATAVVLLLGAGTAIGTGAVFDHPPTRDAVVTQAPSLSAGTNRSASPAASSAPAVAPVPPAPTVRSGGATKTDPPRRTATATPSPSPSREPSSSPTSPAPDIRLLGVSVNVAPRGGDVSCGEGDAFVFTASVTSQNAGVIEYTWFPDPELATPARSGSLTFPAAQTRRVEFVTPRKGSTGETLHAGIQFHITSPASAKMLAGDEYYVTCT